MLMLIMREVVSKQQAPKVYAMGPTAVRGGGESIWASVAARLWLLGMTVPMLAFTVRQSCSREVRNTSGSWYSCREQRRGLE